MTHSYELVCRIKPYIQPFERLLALKELEALAGTSPVRLEDEKLVPEEYSVISRMSATFLASRLAYWELVYPQDGNPSNGVFTSQVRREATTSFVRNGAKPGEIQQHLPFPDLVPLPKRRNLRYGTHGIHEYRGKFFPQLVVSLLNISGAVRGSIILDPMCGSGTTLVEATLMGCQAIGLDVNPLSVLMSGVKCNTLSVNPDRLLTQYRALRRDLSMLSVARHNSMPWFEHLPGEDQDYLSRWFAPKVLVDLDPIATRIQRMHDSSCRALFQISLSNILRSVSWQKDDDLRARKDKTSNSQVDVASVFLTELDRSIKSVLGFLQEIQGCELGEVDVIEGDARLVHERLSDLTGNIDVVVTSPPYATALPYLDTDRLSLCYLGLLPRPKHRNREHKMIGNREISNGQRLDYWNEYEKTRHDLPSEITAVVDLVDKLNRNSDVGFRRRNKAALLARYFMDMRRVFRNLRLLLRPDAPMYVVVGTNYTIAGGRRVDIETDQLLARLGESVGFQLAEPIPMEMLVSRDIFKKNSGSAETILPFKND